MNNKLISIFEDLLQNCSYITGYNLSALDLNLCKELDNYNIDFKKYPNVCRWIKHIKSFDSNEYCCNINIEDLSNDIRPKVLAIIELTESVVCISLK